jgi:hypothetical protein
VGCTSFPCLDVNHASYVMPGLDMDADRVSVVLISEAAPGERSDDYYAGGNSLFQKTTVQAFQSAGVDVSSIEGIVEIGVYLTMAVKCGKSGYGIKAATIAECSHILEEELNLFPQAQAYLLMGDVAIKALNSIARRAGVGRVIPAGSTYKIRGQPYSFKGIRLFPSYLQAGPSYYIEKSKQRMIAEDIAAAMRLVGGIP